MHPANGYAGLPKVPIWVRLKLIWQRWRHVRPHREYDQCLRNSCHTVFRNSLHVPTYPDSQ